MTKSPTIKINAITQLHGNIRVEILDAFTDMPIPGFTLDDFDILNGDIMNKTLSWNGESDLSDYDDVTMRLHVKMDFATIFAFNFE